MQCVSCGAEISDKSKFCPSCGKPQVLQPARVCGNCGLKLREGQIFCSSCGARVVPAAPGAPPPPAQPDGPPPVHAAPVPPPPPVQPGTPPRQDTPVQPPPQINKPPLYHNAPPQSGPLPGTAPVAPETVAGVGFRAVAVIIDAFALSALSYIIAAIFGTTTAGGFELTGVSFFLASAAGFFYYLFFEGILGATPGKLATGLRVVKTDGSKCDLGAAAVRTVFRLVDGLPLFYLLGAVLVWTSPRKQRLGDRVASTMVVKGGGFKATRVSSYNKYNFEE